MRILKILLAIIVVLTTASVLPAGVFAAAVITNGSFETPIGSTNPGWEILTNGGSVTREATFQPKNDTTPNNTDDDIKPVDGLLFALLQPYRRTFNSFTASISQKLSVNQGDTISGYTLFDARDDNYSEVLQPDGTIATSYNDYAQLLIIYDDPDGMRQVKYQID